MHKEHAGIFSVSAVICFVSFTLMLLGQSSSSMQIWRIFSDRRFEKILQFIRSPYLGITAFLVFLIAVLLKPYVSDCADIVKDMTKVGFDYLSCKAKKSRRTTSSLAKKILKRRDPGILPPVFPNGWIPILESRDLKVGQVKPVFALGTEFTVFRGENRTSYVFDAFCPHLGANFSVGGRVRGNCIECPFHGWKFRGDDGACVNIPYSNKVPEVAKAKTWPSCEVNEFIYIWYHADEEPPSWEVCEVANITNKSWVYRGRTEHVVRCHIQEIPENGADIAHFSQVHESSVFSGMKISYLFGPLCKFIKHDWTPSWEPQPPPYKHMAHISLRQKIESFGFTIPYTGLKMDVKQIGPANVHIEMDCIFGKGILIQNIIPEEPLQQRIIHQLYTEPSFKQWCSNLFLFFEADMVERDIVIWNNKKFIKNPILVKEDKNINRFRKWYSQFYSANSPKMSDFVQNCSDW